MYRRIPSKDAVADGLSLQSIQSASDNLKLLDSQLEFLARQ
jgi:hypothetical protein